MNVEEQLSSKYTKYDRIIFPIVSLSIILVLVFNLEYILDFLYEEFLIDDYAIFFMGSLGALALYAVMEFFLSFETQHVWLAHDGFIIEDDKGKQTIPFHLIDRVKESRALMFRSSRIILFIKEENELFLPGRVAFLPKLHKERFYIPLARNPVMKRVEGILAAHTVV